MTVPAPAQPVIVRPLQRAPYEPVRALLQQHGITYSVNANAAQAPAAAAAAAPAVRK